MKIDRPRGVCTSCQEPFKNGSTYTSTLSIGPEGGWVRNDHCEACFQNFEAETIAEWKVRVEKKKKQVLSESAIWQVLKSDQPGLGEKPLTYILCLMMMRKRKLRLTKTAMKKGREHQTYSNKSRKVDITVMVPHLTPGAFHKLQNEMDDFFSSDEV